MKQMMKKRITALLLTGALAAMLSLSAFAADEPATSAAEPATDTAVTESDSTSVTITGNPYYGTDYVQFDIHGNGATNLFYDVLCDDVTVYQHVHYEPNVEVNGDQVNTVGIDLTELGADYKGKETSFSIRVYTGRTAGASATTASIAGIYARLGEDETSDVLIGTVVEGADATTITFPPTYYDAKNETDYNLVSGTMVHESGRYFAKYEPYTPATITGSITYVSANGETLKSETIDTIKHTETGNNARSVELDERIEIQNDGQTLYYYPTVQTVKADYYGQVDFVVLCNAYAAGDETGGLVQIHYMAGDKEIWSDRVNLRTTTFLYSVPQSFAADLNGTMTLYTFNENQDAQLQQVLTKDGRLALVPGRAQTDYYLQYTAADPNAAIQWQLILMDGTTNTRLGTDTMEVQPGETVTYTPAAMSVNGTAYVPSQESYSYTYGGDNLVQYVYYTPDGYVPAESYTVTLQFVNIANGAVLQSESVMVNPGADTEIACPAQFDANGNTYVRLGGQNDTYRHSYYSPKRTYTIFYRDVNDTLYANTIITNIETVTTERTETGVTYVEDITTVTGGTATGPAYATGPAAGTGITGITDDTTGMNQAVNEEGQDLAEEREEQIAEGETPLAQAPGSDAAPEESIGENDTAKAGVSTALVTGGTIAALVVAAVLIVLIVTQRKRNRSTRH